ncbi:cytochrome P450 [Xylariomycetidae sp. FL2044]|nr:cytochrome P450 [Xylariomycetidae sp. FL2044]
MAALSDAIFASGPYAVALLLPFLLLVVIHRIALHPLRAYPGPAVAKISDFYGGLQVIFKRTHLDILRSHEEYGPVVRYGPNRLLFNTVGAFRDIYLNPRLTKSHFYVHSRLGGNQSIFSTFDRETHRQKRQVIGQPINERSMRTFEPTMLEQVDIFLRIVRDSSAASVPLNVTERCQRLGFDIVGHLAFGCALKLQTQAENRLFLSFLRGAKGRVAVYMQYPFLAPLESVLRMLPSSQRKRFRRKLSQIIQTRVSEGHEGKHDLYSIVAANVARGAPDPLGSDMWAEAIFFITAGGTPPATVMSALFFYLSRYPDVYQRLSKEIRETFASGDDIRGGPLLTSCKYLRACIEETLRMAPPNVSTLWREQIENDQDTGPLVVDGHVVPRGTQVGVNIYALHHNEKYFRNPFTFDPGRWLEDTQGSDETRPTTTTTFTAHKAFVPFIAGPRSCAGKAMAYLEISLVMAKTIWFFDFEPAPGPLGRVGQGGPKRGDGRGRADEFQVYDVFNAHHDGPYLVFRPRLGA